MSHAHADPDASAKRTFGDSLHSYNVQLGLDSAGPVLFRDTPDMTLSDTTVFVYGGRLAFLFGDERRDNHRIGVGIGYDTVARSQDRKLAMITPELVYATGHPLILQIGLGWAVTSGTTGFADNYKGFSPSADLRYSFGKRRSLVSASLGLTGRVIVATSDFDYSSAYLGAQLDLTFHLGDQGGAQ